ncbi:bcl2-associated agonist of cell death isoform X2 [Pelodiscus sinensis]|uniref:bcl2-associated agonist of cell death isoform X2 n=1 Tax=Pelodiscus sinensis TaxID=13735 RepID=UPI003F6CD295
MNPGRERGPAVAEVTRGQGFPRDVGLADWARRVPVPIAGVTEASAAPGRHAPPLSMFRIQEFPDEVFPGQEQESPAPPESQREATSGSKQLGTPAADLRGRIGSDPPLEPEVPDEPGGAFFRARSRSAPPILWAAMRYGRELRRMSDEFDVALQVLPRPKSAGTTAQMHRGSSWKETLQAWLGHRPARDVPPRSPK